MAVAFKVLPIAASHSSQLYLSGSLSVLALGALAVAYAAIALLVTGRSWVIATVAAPLGGVGACAGAMVNILVGVNLAAAASAHMGNACRSGKIDARFQRRQGRRLSWRALSARFRCSSVMASAAV